MKRYKLDLILSIFVILFSLILIIFIIPKQIKVPEDLKGTYLSPSALPSGYSIFLLIIGIVLLATTILSKNVLEKEEDKVVYIEKGKKKEGFLLTVKIWIMFFIYMILLKYLGIIISSILFMFFTIMYFGNGSKKVAISVSILVPVLLYVFFRYLADVPLPNGFLFDYFF